ncbi:MAG: endonuclease domain-containing protein [Pseudonocardiaceae bacterium]
MRGDRPQLFFPLDQPPIPLHETKEQCTHRGYYLTCDQFDMMKWRAGGRCEICRVRAKDVQKRPLYIDHDRRLGNGFDHVRGLLCARCNAHLRWCDNGYKLPNPHQQYYLDMAWFWELLPPERVELPFLPPPTTDTNSSAWYRLPRAEKRRLGEENLRLRQQRLNDPEGYFCACCIELPA